MPRMETMRGQEIIKVRVMNLNAAGAKFLEEPKRRRSRLMHELQTALEFLSGAYKPDLIVLQEIVRFGEPPRDLVRAPIGYHYLPSIAIDTKCQPHPDKWSKYYQRGGWPRQTYLAQGYGIMWRDKMEHCAVWNFNPCTGPDLEVESVRIDTGLFTGNRDTEPRLAVVAHFVTSTGTNRPVDFFIVNLHLTTLKGEREGLPERDEFGSKVRMTQLDIVLHGIVTRYEQWRRQMAAKQEPGRKKELEGRPPAVWCLVGDFNTTPNSVEIHRLALSNYLDMNPHKGSGTKAKGLREPPTLTLDYIFAGPRYVALDPYVSELCQQSNPKPLEDVKVSDHYPIYADVPICVSVAAPQREATANVR